MSKIIGIDLGTTNSCVAVYEGGEPVIIPNAEGNRTTPSVVAFTKQGERLVGETAKRQAITNPERTISSIKREMGTDYRIEIDGQKLTPQDISAMILGKLKQDAEAYLGQKVTEAVITVPAYFSDAQRQATKDAGRIAGLDVKRIINEPTAASLSYGLDKSDAHQKIMVYDLGGGTFDVSILEIGDNVFEVLATNGNNHLGGDDFDKVLVDFLADAFQKENGVDLRKDNMSHQRLKEAAEKAKKELSTVNTTNVNLPFITATAEGPLHLNMDVTRAKFESLTAFLVNETIGPMEKAMKDAGVTASDLNQIILVGGSTRIPAVQAAVKKITGKDPHKGINPDECVAIGAAIQGGVLAGDDNIDVLLLDVTPLSLGIETQGAVFTKLIERNTTIPTKKSQVFSTAADNQTAVEIHVLQGERSMAMDNTTLGRFQLDGIPPARRGIPQIEVTFDIDANGIVNVSAKDLGTGKEQHITITSSTNLTEDEIKKRVEEAEKFREEDDKRKKLIDVKNHAESFVYEIEKNLDDLKDSITEAESDAIKEKVEALKKEIESNDVDRIEAAQKTLVEAFQPLAAKLYNKNNAGQAQAGPEQANQQDEGVNPDNVVDADYEEID